MKNKIRLVFLLVIVVFVAGFQISRKFDQPYPAIIFPSFSAIPNVSSPIRKPKLEVFFHNQDSAEVNSNELFYQLPDYFSNVILKENFTEKKSFFSSSRIQKRSNKKADQDLTKKIKTDTVVHNKHINECVLWVRNRLTQMLQRPDVERLEVQWYNYSFDFKNKSVKDSLAEKFIVNLNQL